MARLVDPSRAIALATAKRTWRAAVLWGLVFGATIAASASTYVSSFPSAELRANVAASIEGNVAFEALFGPIHHIDTVAGYTAYKTMYTVIILGSIWGLLAATRALRGDEDAGRWDLLLAGETTRVRATAQVVAGLGAGFIAAWVPTFVLTAAAGRGSDVAISASASFFFVTAVLSATAMFMAVGVLASQLAPTRHDANMIGAGVLATSYLVRMVADSASTFGWLRWFTPFGWIEELRPLTASRPLAFVPIVLFVGTAVLVAVRLAGRRDAGASIFAPHDRHAPHTLLLGGQGALTVRLTRTSVLTWLGALAASGLAFGLVTQAAGSAAKSSPTLERVIERLGGRSAGAVAYLGYVFIFAAALVAIAVAGQIAAIRNEEASGHLDNLLVQPISRWRWLSSRLAVGVGLVIVSSALTGVAAWIGAISQGTDVGFGELLLAGLNVAPPALFVLGVGAVVYGVFPRYAIGATYGLVVWSFLVETLAGIFDSNHWLRDTSPFLHIAPAPAADPNWTTASWLTALAVAACVIGVVAFNRRDVVGA